MSYFIVIIASIVSGFVLGLVISVKYYPRWEVKKLHALFHKEGYKDGDWKHFNSVVDHTVKVIVKPNCETLYSTTFLSNESLSYKLSVPPIIDFFSITFLDANTNVVGYITNADISSSSTKHFELHFTQSHLNESDKIYLKSGLCWIIARFGIGDNADLELVKDLQLNLLLEKL